jgi:hypothetical protein
MPVYNTVPVLYRNLFIGRIPPSLLEQDTLFLQSGAPKPVSASSHTGFPAPPALLNGINTYFSSSLHIFYIFL